MFATQLGSASGVTAGSPPKTFQRRELGWCLGVSQAFFKTRWLMADAREEIRDVLDKKLDAALVNQLFENVLAIEKTARGWCPNCKKQVQTTIPDAKAVVSALNELLVQAKGRPGTSESGEDRSVVFENKVVLVSDGEA